MKVLFLSSIMIIVLFHLFRHVGYLRHQQQVDLWPFDLETGVRVVSDVGYLCANFSQTSDVRQTSGKSIA